MQFRLKTVRRARRGFIMRNNINSDKHKCHAVKLYDGSDVAKIVRLIRSMYPLDSSYVCFDRRQLIELTLTAQICVNFLSLLNLVSTQKLSFKL